MRGLNSDCCACAADEKCLCVVDCLEGVTGGNSNGLDDLLGLDLDCRFVGKAQS